MTGWLEGKVALVTGGGSGIGRATALALAREGASVAVADRDADAAAAVQALIGAAGGEALAIQADVARADAVTAMLELALRRFGALDCLVNNAGISAAGAGGSACKLGELPDEVWDQVLAVNLTGVFLCMKAALPALLECRGAIVNIASIAGLIGLPMAAAYVASKHGVVGLTRAAALDYAAHGLRVNAVCPGYVQTGLTGDLMQRRGAAILDRIPMGRLGAPEDIAETVTWLCSSHASYVTGAVYTIDGGQTAG